MKHGIVFLVLGAGLVWAAAIQGGVAWALAWPGAALCYVALAYIANRPRWLGKKDNGRRNPVINLLLFPYFALAQACWSALRRIRKVPAYDTLTPDVFIGRRLHAREMPPEIATIVDLTAEFRERYRVRSGRTYIGCPILDGMTPGDGDLLRLLERIEAAPRPVYIHCAEGHGRTGLVACALLITRGEAEDPGTALERVREHRPRVKLSSAQARQLDRLTTLLESHPIACAQKPGGLS